MRWRPTDYDAAIVDLHMPGVSGLDLLRAVARDGSRRRQAHAGDRAQRGRHARGDPAMRAGRRPRVPAQAGGRRAPARHAGGSRHRAGRRPSPQPRPRAWNCRCGDDDFDPGVLEELGVARHGRDLRARVHRAMPARCRELPGGAGEVRRSAATGRRCATTRTRSRACPATSAWCSWPRPAANGCGCRSGSSRANGAQRLARAARTHGAGPRSAGRARTPGRARQRKRLTPASRRRRCPSSSLSIGRLPSGAASRPSDVPARGRCGPWS